MISTRQPSWPRLETPLTDISSATADTAYIRRYAELGAILTAITAISCLLYFVATPEGQHRFALQMLCAPAVAIAAAVMFVARRLVGGRWEIPFFYCFSAAAMVLITAVSAFDGGASSPLSVLLILPVVYTSISYPMAGVWVITCTAQSVMLLLMALGDDWSAVSWLRFVILIVFNILAVTSATNRATYQASGRELAVRAMHDDLTRCLSYGAFNDCLRLEAARATRHGRPFTVLIADVDYFKQINDTFGHPIGDDVLRRLATALTNGTRTEDAVGRLGGDEFGILLVDTHAGAGHAQAERLRMLMRGVELSAQVTVSIGVATWTGPGDSAADVLRRADTALYAAKAAGRDRTLCDTALASA
ncbi:MAG TPA: GGDEF domain-containing protein [Ilumatobacteraceae bacterium]